MMFFRLSLPEVWQCHYSQQWIREMQRGNILCSICSRVLPGWFPQAIDVVINTRSYPIRPYHRFVSSQTGIGLIEQRLYDRLAKWLPEVAVGTVRDLDGHLITSHVSYYPKGPVDPRGYKHRYIEVCPECATIRVYSASEDPEYFVEFQVDGAPCVVDRVGAVYVSEIVARQIDLSDLKPAYLLPIDVLKAPMDGLRFPTDPPWVVGQDARVPVPE